MFKTTSKLKSAIVYKPGETLQNFEILGITECKNRLLLIIIVYQRKLKLNVNDNNIM